MKNVEVRSPFADKMAEEWIIWCGKAPLSMLKQEKQTEGRSDLMKEEAPRITESAYVPQTNRYKAVMSRINQASRKTGSFSAWGS